MSRPRITYTDVQNIIEVTCLGSFFSILLGMLTLVVGWVDASLARRFSRKEPGAAIALQLFSVISSPFGYRWSSLTARQQYATALQRAAVSMEFDLPARMECGDPAVDLAVRQATAQRAAALRDLARRIVLSSRDKTDEIEGELIELVRKVCQLDWESLPEKEASALSKREKATAWVQSAGRGLLYAALPTALLILVRRYPLGIAADQLSWVNLVLLVWLGLALNGLIDPDYGATSKVLDTLGKLNIPFIKKKREGQDD